MAEILKIKGAVVVNAYATHGICSGSDFFDRLDKSRLDMLFLSDSLPSKNTDRELKSRVTRVPIDDLVVEYITRTNESV